MQQASRPKPQLVPAVIASDTFGFADWQAMAAIAAALARTEGRHPLDLESLEPMALDIAAMPAWTMNAGKQV